MKRLIMVLVSTWLLAGCGATPDGAFDEAIAEDSAAMLTTARFRLKNYQTGHCMGVKAGTPTQGTPIITWNCDDSANQTWRIGNTTRIGQEGSILINAVAADTCLLTQYPVNGSPAYIHSCTWSDGYKPVYAGNDLSGNECYRFVKSGTQRKVLGVKGGSTVAGTTIILWDDFGSQYWHPDQIWCVDYLDS